MRNIRTLTWLALGLLLGAVSTQSLAVLSISICGHATYTCKASADWSNFGATLGGDAGTLEVTDGSGNKAVIPLNPKTVLPTPSGWGAPSGGAIDPTPPTTASQSIKYGQGNNGIPNVYATVGGAAQALADAFQAGGACGAGGPEVATVASVSGSNFTLNRSCSNYPAGGWAGVVPTGYTASSASTCPTGYTISGGTCINPVLLTVVKPVDSSIAVRRVGNAFVPDAADADVTLGTAAAALAAVISGSTATIGSTALGGTVTVAIAADGTAVVTLSQPGTASGTSNVTRVGIGVPNGTTGTALVDGYSYGTVNGTGSLQGSAAPAGEPDTGSSRESTQLGVKSALDTLNANGVKVDEQATVTAAARADAATAMAAANTAAADHQAKFSTRDGTVPGLTTFSPPAAHDQGGFFHGLFPAPAACAPVSFSYGPGFTMDFCPVVSYAQPFLTWLLYGATAFYIYALVWRRRQTVEA